MPYSGPIAGPFFMESFWENFWSDLSSLMVRAARSPLVGRRVLICMDMDGDKPIPILRLDRKVVRLAPNGAISIVIAHEHEGVFIAEIKIPPVSDTSRVLRDLRNDPVVTFAVRCVVEGVAVPIRN